jgi:hypothetical protein
MTARQVLASSLPPAGLSGFVSTQAQAVAAAAAIVGGGTDAQLAKAHTIALAILDHEPGNVVAVRTMALIAAHQGRQAAALAWLKYGESLSRRDVVTEFSLIQSKVAEGNIAGALLHYNRAMLVNVSSRDVLLPVLISAVNDVAIARELAPILRRRPAWWAHFMGALSGGGSNPATLRLLFGSLRLNIGNPPEAAMLGSGLARMVALGDSDGAFAFYRSFRGAPSGLLRDGSFEQTDAFGPFEWTLFDNGASASRQERTDGRGLALFVLAGDTDSTVAGQVLLLTPGDYSLAGRLASDSDAAPQLAIRIRCGTGEELAIITSTNAGPSGRLSSAHFHVSEGCKVVNILITVAAGAQGQTAGWVDDVAVARL